MPPINEAGSTTTPSTGIEVVQSPSRSSTDIDGLRAPTRRGNRNHNALATGHSREARPRAPCPALLAKLDIPCLRSSLGRNSATVQWPGVRGIIC